LSSVKKNIIIILILLSISVFYRFYNLQERGLFEWDEGYYTQLVTSYRAGFDYLLKSNILHQDIGSFSQYLLKNGGTFKSVFKDGFTYSSFLTSFFFGINHNIILNINALIGALSVLLIYIALKGIVGRLYALIIALGLAISPYHIAFSRGGHSVIFASFYLLFCLSFYVKSIEDKKNKSLFLSAIFLGLSFSCHYTIGAVVVAFFLLEGYKAILKKSLKKVCALFSGFVLPLLFIEAISRVIKYFIQFKLNNLPTLYSSEFVTYFERALQQFREAQAGPAVKGMNWLYYPNNIISNEGAIIFLLLVFSLYTLCWYRRNKPGLHLAVLFIISFLIITIVTIKADRVLLPYIVFIYLVIGYGLNSIIKGKRMLISILLILIIINAYRSIDFFNYRSNFDQAVFYMQEGNGIKHISDDMYVSRSYVGRTNAIDDFISIADNQGSSYDVDLKRIKNLYDNGYRYFLCYSQPYRLNQITEAALSIDPDFTVASWGNNRGSKTTSYGLLRTNKMQPSRFIHVWRLERVMKNIVQTR